MRLDARAIEAALSPGPLPWRLVVMDEVPSTMDAARDQLRAGAGHGLAVFAGSQRSGRGRRGARWQCPPWTGILLTAVLDLPRTGAGATAISWLGALACATCCRDLGVPAGTKWPNDVVVPGEGGLLRKVAGVLVESNGPRHLVGIGLNVNQTARDFPPECALEPTSLRLETGRAHDLCEVAAGLLNHLGRIVGDYVSGGAAVVFERWNALSVMAGRRWIADTPDGALPCVFVGVTPTGDAEVELEDGRRRCLTAATTHFGSPDVL